MEIYLITPPTGEQFYTRDSIHPADCDFDICAVNSDNEHLVTVGEIRFKAAQLAEWLIAERGYSDARFYQCEFGRLSVSVRMALDDEFQKTLQYDQKIECGIVDISVARLFGDWSTWMSREMRELHVMAAKLAVSPDLLSQLQSSMAQQFVRDLQAQGEKLNTLLAAPKATQ